LLIYMRFSKCFRHHSPFWLFGARLRKIWALTEISKEARVLY
jgi:hypothetical protein